MHFAAWAGNIESINTLLKHEADLNIVNSNGIGLMHIAAQADQPALLVFSFRQLEQVYLREKGMGVSVGDKWGSTPLHWACYMAAENAVSYLLASVNNLNLQDVEGLTPLHLATWSALRSGNLKPMKLLLMRGASRHVRVLLAPPNIRPTADSSPSTMFSRRLRCTRRRRRRRS